MRINFKTMKLSAKAKSAPKARYSLAALRAKAHKLGIVLDVEDCKPRGYWLLDTEGNGIWPDDNFCATLGEVAEKLDRF
jgi:hypothetical protein